MALSNFSKIKILILEKKQFLGDRPQSPWRSRQKFFTRRSEDCIEE
jgi:hypothetical protein